MRARTPFLRQHRCWFELLEVRKVLSATLGADALSVPAGAVGYLQLQMPHLHATAGPTGFSPAQIQKAYGISSILFNGGIKGDGKGQTIAIVDPGNAPTITADLHAFDTQFGLPDPPSFRVVNQNGSSNPNLLPIDDPDTAVEIALDVEWSHAVAPGANILLVEVLDPFSPNSGGALDPTQMYLGNLYARSQPGVVVVSNSWGGGEALGENANDYVFTTPSGHAGETFVFSAGDSGGPASYPAASPNVLSVGGTSLKVSSTNNYSSEVVWNDKTSNNGAGGGGLSSILVQQPGGRIQSLGPLENTPNYQKSLGLNGRATPDVTFNADPLTGFSVYDSFTFGATTPWEIIGGTSAGAPIWSGLIAIADQGRALSGKGSLANAQAVMYTLPSGDFHDITVGNNDYLGFGLGITGNAAGPGYDLASGLGSPFANLVVKDLVAFNGSTLVSFTGGVSSGVASSAWFPFLKRRAAISASPSGDDYSSIDLSDTALAAAIDPSADLTTLEFNSGAVLPDSATTDTAAINPDAALRIATADDGIVPTSHGGRHHFDLNSSDSVLDDLFAKF
jgi:subtilase family serine protease